MTLRQPKEKDGFSVEVLESLRLCRNHLKALLQLTSTRYRGDSVWEEANAYIRQPEEGLRWQDAVFWRTRYEELAASYEAFRAKHEEKDVQS